MKDRDERAYVEQRARELAASGKYSSHPIIVQILIQGRPSESAGMAEPFAR